MTVEVPFTVKVSTLWKEGFLQLPPDKDDPKKVDFGKADPVLVESRWTLREKSSQIGAKAAKERAYARENGDDSVDN